MMRVPKASDRDDNFHSPQAQTPSGPSASGARIGGDDVQHLIAWYYWLKACTPGSGISAVTIEAADSATVDDVVILYEDGRCRRLQVKASVTVGSGALSTDWLLEPSSGKTIDPDSKTLLRQLFNSWNQLGRPSEGIELVTTRSPAHGDLLINCIDHTNRIGPRLRIAKDRSDLAKERKRVAEHLGCSVPDLCDFLDALRISSGQREADWRERVEDAAGAAGVDRGPTTQAVGVGAVREWVKTTRDPKTAEELRSNLKNLGVEKRSPRAHVVIETLAPFFGRDDAAITINWVDKFAGDRPENRRGVLEPKAWTETFPADLSSMRVSLEQRGLRKIAVSGTMRLPTWFAVGAELREVAGFDVAAHCRNQVWEPPTGSVSKPDVQIRQDRSLGSGSETVLVVEISSDGTRAALDHFENSPDVGRLLAITAAGGPDRRLLADGSSAMGTAYVIRDWIRTNLANTTRLHLVLVGPAVLALYLGHLWDRVPPTTIYEDLGQRGYEAAFRFG
jgi:SMODS-associated and fused to various effectors sensor domain